MLGKIILKSIIPMRPYANMASIGVGIVGRNGNVGVSGYDRDVNHRGPDQIKPTHNASITTASTQRKRCPSERSKTLLIRVSCSRFRQVSICAWSRRCSDFLRDIGESFGTIQMLLQEFLHRFIRFESIFFVMKAVAFVLFHEIGHINAALL